MHAFDVDRWVDGQKCITTIQNCDLINKAGVGLNVKKN